MKLEFQVRLDCLHLENALFAAEQSASGGADALEIGASLLSNTGIQTLKIFKERLPNIRLVADLKIVQAEAAAIKAAKEAGASEITVCGAISLHNWEKITEQCRQLGIRVSLDFRDLPPGIIKHQLALLAQADCLFFHLDTDTSEQFLLMQEAAMRCGKPLAVSGIVESPRLPFAMGLGTTTFILPYDEAQNTNIRSSIEKARSVVQEAQSTQIEETTPQKYSEKLLRQKLARLMPSHVCAVCQDTPSAIEKVYPLHRFTKIYGPAVTAKVCGGARQAFWEFLCEVPAQSIVVVENYGGDGGPMWNGLATVLAMKNNLAGAVVWGSVSEVNIIRGKGFPCYVTSLTPLPPKEPLAFFKNVPLQLGSVVVRPGDWLLGDDSGIVAIPSDKLWDITEAAENMANQGESLLREVENTSEIAQIKTLLDKIYKK